MMRTMYKQGNTVDWHASEDGPYFGKKTDMMC